MVWIVCLKGRVGITTMGENIYANILDAKYVAVKKNYDIVVEQMLNTLKTMHEVVGKLSD